MDLAAATRNGITGTAVEAAVTGAVDRDLGGRSTTANFDSWFWR
jgi:hypothetical protein